jgi:hypothetical protein
MFGDGKNDQDDWMIDPDWAANASAHITLSKVKNERQGVAAEKAWIQTQFPNHQKLRQRCRKNEAGRQIDEIILKAPDGKEVSVFFDITDWFGK